MIDTTNGVRLADAPKIGTYWEGQGGVYAGIMPDYEGTQPRFLIFAEDEAVDISWGPMGTTEDGAHSHDYGAANTRDLVNCRKRAHDHDAARFAAGYEKDGHKDFYLPARRELNVAYQTIRESFDETDLYWSSTEESALTARVRHFGDAEPDYLFKRMTARVRPMRSMPVMEDAPAAG
ncbi:hypothetical protein [Trinickia sp.]|uniref:hypothetical protein n=1 Tax=Trinickia sp. TaxID=2571163 RepID=UPI003F7F938E